MEFWWLPRANLTSRRLARSLTSTFCLEVRWCSSQDHALRHCRRPSPSNLAITTHVRPSVANVCSFSTVPVIIRLRHEESQRGTPGRGLFMNDDTLPGRYCNASYSVSGSQCRLALAVFATDPAGDRILIFGGSTSASGFRCGNSLSSWFLYVYDALTVVAVTSLVEWVCSPYDREHVRTCQACVFL